MTVAETRGQLTERQLGEMIQYTVEAYKTFEKLAESLPNPMTAAIFKQFAADERGLRDLIDMKIEAAGAQRIRVTLAGDLAFQGILEGEMSYREIAESLIYRERTMEKKVADATSGAAASDRNLLIYVAAVKRAHMVELDRELQLIREDRDWWKREDAEWRIVHGTTPE